MESHTKANGSTDKERDRANKSGPTDQDMSASGRLIRQMEKEFCITQMGISTKVSGWKIRPVEKVSILTRMGPVMKENGDKISKMVSENKNGQTDKYTKDITKMDASMAKEN